MTILTISGSPQKQSTNTQLLKALAKEFPSLSFDHHPLHLPLFHPDLDQSPYPQAILAHRQRIAKADALIISTPAYLYNIPANLKNALEWLSTSGELRAKPILAITFTPHPPRGEKAMQSLLWSLQALEARIVGQLALYQTEIKFKKGRIVTQEGIMEMLKEAIGLLL